MNKKGFTLIEMIGVIIIMALILMIIFPATSKLLKDNEEKRFDYYYDIVTKGSDVYASSRRDDLGGVDGVGCIDDIKLSELIGGDYITEFDEEEVTCGTPSEFNLSELEIPSKDYVNIRIKNNKGKISSEVSLICVEGKKVLYSKLIEKTGTCNSYVAEAKDTLLSAASKLSSTTDDNQNYFLSGSINNNYVWYSGKLWRIVSYNKNDKTVKLVTDEPVSILSYDMSYSNYSESNISVWLNNTFLSTLKNPDTYLVDYDWDFSIVTDTSKPNGTNTTTSKVGMLNLYEYNKVKGFLNIPQNWWLLSRLNNGDVWYVKSSTSGATTSAAESSNVARFYGVRPSIVLKPNITYISGGNGTTSNPYKLGGDSSANPGTALNTRYSGEYVNFGGYTYRIVSTSSEYTRLIMVSNLPVGNTIFDDLATYTYNNGTKIGEFLNVTWYNELSENDKAKMTNGDFCTMMLTPTISQTTLCPLKDIVNLKIGIPKIGDMFTTSNGSEYWTLSNGGGDSIWTVNSSGDTVTGKNNESTSGVRPVINISNTVLISGGNGTKSSPYTLQ